MYCYRCFSHHCDKWPHRCDSREERLISASGYRWYSLLWQGMSSWRNVIEAIAGSSCPQVLDPSAESVVRTRSRFPFEDLALTTFFCDLAHHPKGPTVSPAPLLGDEMFKYLSLSETFPIQPILCANVITPWIPEAKGIFPLFYCRFAQLLLPWPPTSRDHRKWMVDLFCFGFFI